MSAKLVNFRAPESTIAAYDRAAKQAGMSRSDWLRNAAERQLAIFVDSGFTIKVPSVKLKESACIDPKGPDGCPYAEWQDLPTGIRECATCGDRCSKP